MPNSQRVAAATLRISAVLAMLWALPVSPASAVPVQVVSGGIGTDWMVDLQFASYELAGPGFTLASLGYKTVTNFSFYSSVANWPGAALPGSVIDFSARVMIPISPPGVDLELVYGGESYVSQGGEILITTPQVVAGNPITLPFTYSGWIAAWSPTTSTFYLEFAGGGTMRAEYHGACCGPPEGPQFLTDLSISYVIEPTAVPDPTTWMLLGSGLLGFAARRRSARLNR